MPCTLGNSKKTFFKGNGTNGVPASASTKNQETYPEAFFRAGQTEQKQR
jgi:hypothetical protein